MILKAFILFVSVISAAPTGDCRLVENALHHKMVQHYLHPEMESRRTLYLVKSEYCDLTGTVGKIRVITVEKPKLQSTNFIEINSVTETEEGFELSASYPIEGVAFQVKYNNDYKITDVNIIEK